MKITKRQLRRIIKEEKQKLVEQSLTNWPEPEEDNLYTNLTDDQENALGALENAIKDCINEGCKADECRRKF